MEPSPTIGRTKLTTALICRLHGFGLSGRCPGLAGHFSVTLAQRFNNRPLGPFSSFLVFPFSSSPLFFFFSPPLSSPRSHQEFHLLPSPPALPLPVLLPSAGVAYGNCLRGPSTSFLIGGCETGSNLADAGSKLPSANWTTPQNDTRGQLSILVVGFPLPPNPSISSQGFSFGGDGPELSRVVFPSTIQQNWRPHRGIGDTLCLTPSCFVLLPCRLVFVSPEGQFPVSVLDVQAFYRPN